MKIKEKNPTDTTAADRYALDNTREGTELLVRFGKLSPEEVRLSQELRASVGAKPLRLHDLRHLDADAVKAPDVFGADDVRNLRVREGASQAVFARHMGVTVKALSQWERGLRKPEGPAAKLLTLVKAHGLQHIRG